MLIRAGVLAAFLSVWAGTPGRAAEPPEAPADLKPIKIRPKRIEAPRQRPEGSESTGLNAAEAAVIDAPTAAVLDYGGYSSQTRAYSHGGLLEYASFGVYPRLNLGASLAINGLIGNDTTVRVRPPEVQVKFRCYDGDRYLPALGVGYDGQGYDYSPVEKKFHDRQRGFYVVATQELGLPGLQAHPSFNISDFDSNSIFGSIPLTYGIQDKAVVLFEWDNIGNFNDSRINSGLRVYLTPKLRVDFAVRRIGQGGWFADNTSRGPERIVQLKYSGSF
ncbi:MAG: hypothetical protein PHU21_00545 [Elusimicrobia bacterium]|nr:hypothetical protein [Elusimicrobiota bacterium]